VIFTSWVWFGTLFVIWTLMRVIFTRNVLHYFITIYILRMRLIVFYVYIHKPKLQAHACGRLKNYQPHAFRINTLHTRFNTHSWRFNMHACRFYTASLLVCVNFKCFQNSKRDPSGTHNRYFRLFFAVLDEILTFNVLGLESYYILSLYLKFWNFTFWQLSNWLTLQKVSKK
jgi:hypothetical protein